MTAEEWNSLTIVIRRAVLAKYEDTEHIDPMSSWELLPYWLRRCLTHFRVPELKG